MHKVIYMNNIFVKIFYYVVALIFHGSIFLTDFGNFFHGGTPLELIILYVIAVVIVVTCIKLIRGVKIIEKIAIIFFALIPAIAIAMGLISAAKRVFTA